MSEIFMQCFINCSLFLVCLLIVNGLKNEHCLELRNNFLNFNFVYERLSGYFLPTSIWRNRNRSMCFAITAECHILAFVIA